MELPPARLLESYRIGGGIYADSFNKAALLGTFRPSLLNHVRLLLRLLHFSYPHFALCYIRYVFLNLFYFKFTRHIEIPNACKQFFRMLDSDTSLVRRFRALLGVIGVKRFIKCRAYPKYGATLIMRYVSICLF